LALSQVGAVSGILSQIDVQMVCEDAEVRLFAVDLFGRILTLSHPAFKTWLNRSHDKIAKVRLAWAHYAVLFVEEDEVEKALIDRLMDPEDRVRERILKDL